MCSISMFTPDELVQVAAQERAKGNKKEAIKIMALAYKLTSRTNWEGILTFFFGISSLTFS